ncbi:MAG: helix-turn-helix domain-containing protein [Chloroflexota bacterium]
MFKIGDFSKLAQVSTRMLRHYDKIGLLTPNEIDEWTGYRYYTIDQLPHIHRIVALKDLGFSLEQITNLLKNDVEVSTERLKGMLTLRQKEIEKELEAQSSRLRSVASRLAQIEQTGKPSPFETTVKSVSSYVAAGYQLVAPHADELGYYCELTFDSSKNLIHLQTCYKSSA